MSSDFYNKYKSLFFDDDPQPISYDLFIQSNPKNQVKFYPHQDIVQQAKHFDIIPKQHPTRNLPRTPPQQHQKAILQSPPRRNPIVHSPAQTKARQKVRTPPSREQRRNIKQFPKANQAPRATSPQPPPPILQYQSVPDNTAQILDRFTQQTKSLQNISTETIQYQKPPKKLPPMEQRPQVKEQTKSRIFPSQQVEEQPKLPPLQQARKKREEFKKKIEYRRERLRDLLSQDKITLTRYER